MGLPEPYYQDDHATIYHGDCLEIMPSLTYDVVVTDPPYGIDLNTNYKNLPGGLAPRNTFDRIAGDDEDFDPSPLLAQPAALFGVNHYAQRLPTGGTWHVWDKRHGMPEGGLMADFELWWTNFPSGSSSVFRHQWQGFMRDGVEKTEGTLHPTQTPSALIRRIVERAPGETIMDPYLGSGTTLRAAKDLARNSIGIEVDERYCEIAAKRLGQEVLDFGGSA